MHSPREQKPKRSRDRGVVYSPLACTDEGDAGLTSRTAFPARMKETEISTECEHEPLLEHST